MLGGPGAGKGTVCKLAQKETGCVHLSAGDLLRRERAQEGSPLKKVIDDSIKAGKMVPGDITVKLIREAILSEKKSTLFLIDGFPRNSENLVGWNKLVGQSMVQLAPAVFFDCKQETMEKRLIHRGKTSGRADDKPEVIKKRFATFVKETVPIVEALRKTCGVISVDANGTVKECYALFQDAIRST